MIWLRYVLPAVLVLAGFAMLFVADDGLKWDGFAMFVGAGLAVLLLNILFRFGAKGDEERQAEDDAREYFTRHGHWPDESPTRRPAARARARCERQACSVWRSGRPWKARSSAPAPGRARARARHTPPRPPRARAGRTPCRRAGARRGARAGSSAPARRGCAAPPPGGRGGSGRRRTARRPRAATGPPRARRGGHGACARASAARLASSAVGASISSSSEPSTLEARRGQHARSRARAAHRPSPGRRHSAAPPGRSARAAAAATAGRRRAGRWWVEHDRELARSPLSSRRCSRGARVLELREHPLGRPPRRARRGAPRRSRRRSRARPSARRLSRNRRADYSGGGFCRRRGERAVDRLDAVAAGALCGVERPVGGAEQELGLTGVVG